MRSMRGVLSLVTVLTSRVALGQTSQEQLARRELVAQAEQERTAGNHTHALDLATRAGEIQMTPSLRLLLANEHRALGHTVDALANASGCVREAQIDATLRNRDRIVEACQAVVTALEPQVGRLRVGVPDPAPTGIQIRVAGAQVARALWGVPYPVAPGEVHVEATADGYRPWTTTVEVRAGQTADATVTMERATDVAVTTPHPSESVATGPTPGAAHDEGVQRSGGPGAGPWVVMGIGVAGFAAAGLFYALAAGAQSDRNTACPSAQCTQANYQSGQDADQRYRTYTYATDVGFAVGGVGLAAGLLWYLLAPRAASRTTQRAVAWSVTPTLGGFAVGIGGAL